MVQCGHTYCTTCLQHFIDDRVATCPIDGHKANNIENNESLPVNQQIFIVLQKDKKNKEKKIEKKGYKVDKSSVITLKGCCKHDGDIMNLICVTHNVVLDEKCMMVHKEYHGGCNIIDVYDCTDPKIFKRVKNLKFR